VILFGLIPAAASVTLALASDGLSRRLAPAIAAPLLVLLGLATATATGLALCLAAFGPLARLPLFAAFGEWSPAALRAGQLGLGAGLLAGTIAAVLFAAALVRAARAAWDRLLAARACRQLGTRAAGGSLVVTRDERPVAFAVAGRNGRIVISTGMLSVLTTEERHAVIAHEEAHLRHHHAAYVLLAEVAAAANPLLRPLARRVRLAVELRADEVAARRVGDRQIVARALARASLAAAAMRTAPASAMALTQTDVRARVRALTEPPRPRPAWAAAAAVALALASGAAALAMVAATHQQIEAAQLAYALGHDTLAHVGHSTVGDTTIGHDALRHSALGYRSLRFDAAR
jgi:Zn-dependent protease with chaperone function